MKRFAFLTFFVLSLALAQQSDAATHYISASASDSITWNNSTAIETPCTVATMLANANDDDICELRAGTYSMQFRPANSGSSGHPITIRAYSPAGGQRETVNLNYQGVSQVNLDTRNYIIIDGLVFQNPSLTSDSSWIDGDYSEHITIQNCTFVDSAYSAHMWWRYSKYLILRNCSVGSANAVATREATVDHMTFTGAEYPLIENCTFRQVQHYPFNSLNLKYGIIRNCIFENTWHAGAGFQSHYPSLIDNCIFKNQGEQYMDNPIPGGGTEVRSYQFAVQTSGDSNFDCIIRRSIFYNNGASYNTAPKFMTNTGYHYFYNNTSDQEYEAVRFGNIAWPSGTTTEQKASTILAGNIFKNNIFYRGREYGIYCSPNTEIYPTCVHYWVNNNFHIPFLYRICCF